MAYEVTATRRRPQRFEDLVGQEFVVDTFKNSIQSGKIAHAYLFSGPRGCGKTSTARILAKALNCKNGPTASPCGECTACKEITAGSSMDVIEIDGASNTSVNDVRQIKDEVLFPPNSCRYKIYIIDEVHMLSTSAFNALLKTIEEPPPYVIFIFATTELQKVPATIKSRCQQFNFRLVPIEKVKEQLSIACKEVGIKAEDEALYWIARESTGSMRDSYTLFDQVAAFSDGEITYDKIRDKLGLVGVDRLNELFDFCVDGNVEKALLSLDVYLQNGVSIEQLISNCTDYLRSILLIKSGIRKESLLGTAAERYSKKVLDIWNSVMIERGLDIFLKLYRDIRYSLSPRYEFELAISRLCWLKEYISPREVKKALDQIKPLLLSKTSSQTLISAESKAVIQTATQSVNRSAPVMKTSVRSALPRFSALQEDYNPDEYASPPDNQVQSQASQTSTQQFPPVQSSPISKSVTKEETAVTKVSIDSSNLESVKSALINELSATDVMLASALTQTRDWTMDGDIISGWISSNFERLQIQQSISKINDFLNRTYGRPVSFDIKLYEQKDSSSEVKLPDQVKIIRDTFKGSVVGGI